MSAPAPSAAPAPALRHVLLHLLVPILLATGMALAYLGAFHQPEPHAIRLDVVGRGPEVAVLASTLQDQLGDRAAVRTVPTADDARAALTHREIAGAYVPDPVRPQLLLATAGSDTTAVTVEKMLGPVALAEGLPLQIDDVAPTADTDPTGQGIFFYLVALSVGAYSAAIAIAAAGGRLPMRIRALLGVGAGGVIALIATLVAGPLYGALPSAAGRIGLLAWLYTTAVVLIGVGLHTFLGRWTTFSLVALFVMLNFTSSGGVFAPEMQPGFFSALHSFWIGSGLVEAGRNLVYFPALGIGRDVTVLLLWLAAALAVVALAALAERRRALRGVVAPGAEGEADDAADHDQPSDDAIEEELEESVLVG
jgi:hypothetical protein